MFDITRHEDGSRSKPCDRCGETVHWYPRQGDTACNKCDAQYNASGQRLRDNWRDNPSWGDDEIGDMEGYEIEMAGDW